MLTRIFRDLVWSEVCGALIDQNRHAMKKRYAFTVLIISTLLFSKTEISIEAIKMAVLAPILFF